MKKQLFSVISVMTFSMISFAQVGINTNNPQSTLHIDGSKDNPSSGVPTATQQLNDVAITSAGNLGVGTIAPTEKLDIATGNVRIRTINSNIGVGGTDRAVVADANGILKTINFNSYSLFHARLAANQAATISIITLLFATPLSTSPYYSYNTTTGVLTFNQAGNYLVTLQASFANAPVDTQLVIGIRPVPDADYLGRGSHYNAVATSTTIGELMNYSTLLIIPTAGYQVRFTAAPNQNCTVLATESGSTGSGNVTNVTIQKI
ncbi:hypothetical protein GCM10023210_02900 [Chryseobacterium ginsengisoli]|uniref:C1q domain-containing protein n=1 Tax=Chryseobacterium ginsengisoli TaxID=363853 RepID=A0ABP9LU77_9FLAO